MGRLGCVLICVFSESTCAGLVIKGVNKLVILTLQTDVMSEITEFGGICLDFAEFTESLSGVSRKKTPYRSLTASQSKTGIFTQAWGLCQFKVSGST